MIKIPDKIEIKPSENKGIGVFATEEIEAGEIIEECLLLTLPITKGETSSLFLKYRFNYPQGSEWYEQVIATGYGCYYNHSDNPNAYWKDHPTLKAFVFTAQRKILKGEEILVYYGDQTYWNDGRYDVLIT